MTSPYRASPDPKPLDPPRPWFVPMMKLSLWLLVPVAILAVNTWSCLREEAKQKYRPASSWAPGER